MLILRVDMLSVSIKSIMLSTVMLNVAGLNVVAPEPELLYRLNTELITPIKPSL